MEFTVEWDIQTMKRIKYANGVQGMVLRTQEGESNAERARAVLGGHGCARRTAAQERLR